MLLLGNIWWILLIYLRVGARFRRSKGCLWECFCGFDNGGIQLKCIRSVHIVRYKNVRLFLGINNEWFGGRWLEWNALGI